MSRLFFIGLVGFVVSFSGCEGTDNEKMTDKSELEAYFEENPEAAVPMDVTAVSE